MEEKATKVAKEGDATLACLRPNAPAKAAPTTLAMAATAERRPAVTAKEEKAREKATKEAKEASANVVCPRVTVTNKPAAPTTLAMAATVPRTTTETGKGEKA